MTELIQVVEEKKTRNRFPDRFTVDPINLQKIGSLLEQLRASVPACDISRKDLVNWILEKFPNNLGTDELNELKDRFYDEERFLRLALEEVRNAKARGEKLSLQDILQKKTESALPVPKARRRKRKPIDSVGDDVLEPTPMGV